MTAMLALSNANVALNRTMLELKSNLNAVVSVPLGALNRTMLELKSTKH